MCDYTKDIIPHDRGLIIIGYQGIGKSSIASVENGIIDLESSTFRTDNGGRHADWYVTYCEIAISLAEQGYIVCLSNHSEVRKELYYRHRYNWSETKKSNYDICCIYPNESLTSEWIDILYNRWKETQSGKDLRALIDAESNMTTTIRKLAAESKIPCYSIRRMDYSLIRMINYILAENKNDCELLNKILSEEFTNFVID